MGQRSSAHRVADEGCTSDSLQAAAHSDTGLCHVLQTRNTTEFGDGRDADEHDQTLSTYLSTESSPVNSRSICIILPSLITEPCCVPCLCFGEKLSTQASQGSARLSLQISPCADRLLPLFTKQHCTPMSFCQGYRPRVSWPHDIEIAIVVIVGFDVNSWHALDALKVVAARGARDRPSDVHVCRRIQRPTVKRGSVWIHGEGTVFCCVSCRPGHSADVCLLFLAPQSLENARETVQAVHTLLRRAVVVVTVPLTVRHMAGAANRGETWSSRRRRRRRWHKRPRSWLLLLLLQCGCHSLRVRTCKDERRM